MAKNAGMSKYIYDVALGLVMICVLFMFQVNKVQAAETTGVKQVANQKVINGKTNQAQAKANYQRNTQAPRTVTKPVNTKVVPSQSTTTPKIVKNKSSQKLTATHNYKNVPQPVKQPVKAPAKIAPKMKPQLLASTVKTTNAKPKPVTPLKKVAVAPKKVVPVNTKKPAVAAKAKPQLLATTTKSQPAKKGTSESCK